MPWISCRRILFVFPLKSSRFSLSLVFSLQNSPPRIGDTDMDRSEQDEQSYSCQSCISTSGEETTSPPPANPDSAGKSLLKLAESDEELTEVKHRFYSNLGKIFAPRCPVQSVYKNLHSSGSSKSRLHAFLLSVESTNQRRGDANIKNAWFSCSSKTETLKILHHGFESCGSSEHTKPHGLGAYLFPLNHPIDSLSSTVVDSNGVQYLILCSVILGRTEEIQPPSDQFSPSSDEFDSGVDNQEFPKKYIIWPAHVKSRICPLYVLCIKPDFRRRELRRMVAPTSPWIAFSRLVHVLCSSLPPEKSRLIKSIHVDFLERKITRGELISRVRVLAGDELLCLAIRFYGSREGKNGDCSFDEVI